MSLYQQFVKHVLYPLDRLRTGDYATITYLKEFEKTQFLSPEEIKQLAWTRLLHILNHAYTNIPYYRDAWDKVGVKPRDIQTESDLLRIPLLEKTDVQHNLERLVDPNFPKDKMAIDQTGGSTGTPVKYYVSKDRRCSRTAATMRHDRWAGHDIGYPMGSLWGAARDMPKPSTKAKIRDTIIPNMPMFNSAVLTEEACLEYNETLKKYRPPVVLAYASSLGNFARILKRLGIEAYQPKGVITSAETLDPEDRKIIEEVCGCKVFNRLGCREVSVIASECEKHDGLHIMGEGLYVEILKNGKHAAPGELGEIVVTDMLNLPMPLIRYRLKDTAAWKEGTCSCGRGLPRISEIAGRIASFLVTADGQLCSGTLLTATIVSYRPTLGQIQMIQTEIGKITYKVAVGNESNFSQEDRDYLREKTSLYLGKETVIDYEFVDHIPHEPSGKYLFSKSTIADQYI